jgi:hypothetical protein
MDTKEILAMSQRERQRFHLVQMVIKGALSLVKEHKGHPVFMCFDGNDTML